MILTGSQIGQAINNNEICIEPFNSKQMNPNSYDLRLAPDVMTYRDLVLDAAEQMPVDQFKIGPEGLLLEPGKLYLMRTVESTASRKYVPGIEGRSSVGRLGISVHVTAGFGDVGFEGTWTLEVSCIQPVRIYAGMRICQVFFMSCGLPQEWDMYAGKYLGQQLPRPSKIWTEKNEWLR